MGSIDLFSGNTGAAFFSNCDAAGRPHAGAAGDAGECGTEMQLSAWSGSAAKRLLDIVCVLCALPVVALLLLLVGLAVRLTSRGPVLFRQDRVGRNGRAFTIFKFRTMPVCTNPGGRVGLTSANNQQFTPIGPFLRRWKLDELPQLVNILRGEMSLVGPRPKLACYESSKLACRPGLTGFATMVFAREEIALAKLPPTEVHTYYQAVVKPLKFQLDAAYMERATLLSDLKIILKSVFRAWDDMALTELPQWNAGNAAGGAEPASTASGIAPVLVVSQ